MLHIHASSKTTNNQNDKMIEDRQSFLERVSAQEKEV